MARAIRVISVQRGHDPRDYTLMAFGGAGPLHAARLAKELDIGRVLVPANPGILCAMGLLLTDLRADFAVTRLLPAVAKPRRASVADGFAALARARRALVRAGSHRARRSPASRRTVDMRYQARTTSSASPCRRARSRRATMRALADGFAARAPPALRLRRRWRSRPARDPAPRGDRAGAQGRAHGASRGRSRRFRRHRPPPPGMAGGERATSCRLRSMTAVPCVPATASPAPPSSSRWTPPPWCRRA